MQCGHPVVDEIPDDNEFKQSICNLVIDGEMSFVEIKRELEDAYRPVDKAASNEEA